jgi:hypothetical protein
MSWETLDKGEVTNYNDPYGDLVDYYEMLKSEDDSRAYTFKERFAMFPGENEYGSGYDNHEGWHKETWSQSNAETNLYDWEPFGGTSGTVSKDAEVSANTEDGVGVAYGYKYSTKETDVDDKSSDRENYARFRVDYYGDSRKNTAGFEPASLAERIAEDYYGSELLENFSMAKFQNPYATESVYHYFDFTFPV